MPGMMNLGMGGVPPILRGAGQYQSPAMTQMMSQMAQQAAPQQMPGKPSWLMRNRGMLGQMGMNLLQSGQRGQVPGGLPQAGGWQGLLGLLQRRG